MFGPARKTTNLGQQILQRETNRSGNSKEFTANLFRERLRVAKNLYRTDFIGHFGCVNAIEFSHGGEFLASGGDDKRVLIWNLEKSLNGMPVTRTLVTEQASNIFCLGFDSKNRKLISGGNDTLAISHDFETGKLENIYKHDGPVYGLSIDPQNDNVFSTASEYGEVLLFDQRTSVRTVVASVPASFHGVEFHPTMSNLLVTANSKRGATLYDLRYPKKPVMIYGNLGNPRSCMSVRFNRTGNLILGLRRRLPPILHNVNSPEPICTFYHSNYYNSCTMKSCTFAGNDDEMVISGSDDFNLYVWRLSDIDLDGTEQWVESTQMVLYGHRSIVNQVRYNREKCLLASSGVEKIIKIWSPFSQRLWAGSLTEEALCSDNPRELYSPYNIFTMALPDNWHHLSHDYSGENTNEDPRMMAFFDSLIQQEIEEWETNSSTDYSELADTGINSFFSCGSTSSNNSSTSDSSTSSSCSICSSDSDTSNETYGVSGRQRTPGKRQEILRKNPQRKQLNKTFKMVKIKDDQLQKPVNRIAYLIAKKRKTLRRLAIKGSSPNNKRSKKLDIVINERKRRSNTRHSLRQRYAGLKKKVQNYPRRRINNEKPTTSAAAAKKALRLKFRKKTPKAKSDPNVSLKQDSGNFPISGSSLSNASNISSSSNNNNNVNIPSTSTGITSNFRDAFLRLSRQIFMSDSDDDELEDDTNKLYMNSNSRTEGIQVIKPNGVNKPSSSKYNNTPAKGSRITSSPNDEPDINSINNDMILPQISHPIEHDLKDHKNEVQSGCSRISSCKRISPLLNAGGTFETHKKRRFAEVDGLDDLPTSSKNSNNDQLNDIFEESTTCTSSSRNISIKSPKNHQQFQSPLKIRKISISDYIKVRSDFSDTNPSSQLEQDGFECNNNETNNNNIFAIEDENINNHAQLTPQRSNVINSENNNTLNDEFAAFSSQYNSHLFTPDSGISLNNTTTPSTTDQNDILTSGSTSTTTARIAAYLSPCYEPTNCDLRNIEEHESDDDEGVIINNRKTNLNQFQKKVARVRRNYRKQFFDDSESD